MPRAQEAAVLARPVISEEGAGREWVVSHAGSSARLWGSPPAALVLMRKDAQRQGRPRPGAGALCHCSRNTNGWVELATHGERPWHIVRRANTFDMAPPMSSQACRTAGLCSEEREVVLKISEGCVHQQRRAPAELTNSLTWFSINAQPGIAATTCTGGRRREAMLATHLRRTASLWGVPKRGWCEHVQGTVAAVGPS